jgi:SsrA-binding protein
MAGEHIKNLVVNRRAKFEFHLDDVLEAGISLVGSEVKSLRAGRANLQEAYVRIDEKGAWLHGCHISPYAEASRNNHDPLRVRQLLLHSRELARLAKGSRDQGTTIIPLRIYLKGSRVKVEISLARGKKLHDKRETIKAREAAREMRR